MGRSRRRYARQRRVEKQNDDPSLMRVTPASRLDHSRARARAFPKEGKSGSSSLRPRPPVSLPMTTAARRASGASSGALGSLCVWSPAWTPCSSPSYPTDPCETRRAGAGWDRQTRGEGRMDGRRQEDARLVLDELEALADVALRLHQVLLDEHRTDELEHVRVLVEFLELLRKERSTRR